MARADTLSWATTYTGPDNLPNGESEPIPVAAGFNAVSFSGSQTGWAVGV